MNMQTRSARPSSFVRQLRRAFVGVLIGWICVEILFRLMPPPYTGEQYRTAVAYDAQVGWRYPPNIRGWCGQIGTEHENYRSRFDTNSAGFRDVQHAIEKGKQYRVILLGDSFSAARQVEVADRWDKLVERGMTKALGRPTEVIGAAIDGWGTDQELLWYESEGFRYSPDLVVVAFYYGNDASENSYRGNGKPYFTLSNGSLLIHNYPCSREKQTMNSRLQYVINHSFVLSSSRNIVKAIHNNGAPTRDSAVYLASYDDNIRQTWKITEAILIRLKKNVEKSGAEMVIVGIPGGFQVQPELWTKLKSKSWLMRRAKWNLAHPVEELHAICQRSDIPFLDLTPQFENEYNKNRTSLYLSENDNHWSKQGNCCAARNAVPWLVQIVQRQQRGCGAHE